MNTVTEGGKLDTVTELEKGLGQGIGSTFQPLDFGGIAIGVGDTARIKGHTIPGVIRVPSEDKYVQKFLPNHVVQSVSQSLS